MYLCLGVFMTLLSKNVFGKPNFATQQNIFETIHNKFGNFEYAPLNKTTLSKCFNCEREINGDVVQEITRLKKEDPSLLFDNFRAIAIDLQKNIIAKSKQTDLVTVIIYIIEHDPEISASTIIGISEYYTRNNLLHAKQINLIEFLENILYFVFCERKNNDSRGNETVKWIQGEKYYTVLSEQLDINLITHNQTNEQNNIFNLNDTTISSIKYPRKLTEYSVIGATKKNILFRDSEYANIINSFHSGVNSILLHGFGGCGKTSLARLIYYTTKDCYDCFGWVDYSKNLKESLINSIKPFSTSAESDSQKKWHEIEDLLTNRNISKLIVIDNIDFIDGIQNPLEDTDLFDISSWSNTKLIATSRLSHIEGFDEIFEISNLGNNDDYSKCIDLFYHYNPQAQVKRCENEEIVKKLCQLASYNTLMIELLAKSSYYNYADLELFLLKLQNSGFYFQDSIPIFTTHAYNATGTSNSASQETLSEQLIKLFNLNNRTHLEQQILWELCCLPENEKISTTELKDWFGYSLTDIDQLVKERWISFEDNWFFVHPLIRNSVVCYYNTQNNIRNLYWERGIQIRKAKGSNNNIIMSLLNNDFSLLSQDPHHKLCNILHHLIDGGNVLRNDTLFNLGYYYYTINITYFSSFYIHKLYLRIITDIYNHSLDTTDLSVSVLAIQTTCVYYLLCVSDDSSSMIKSSITKDDIFHSLFNMTTYISNIKNSLEIKPVISMMYYCLGDYILNDCNQASLEKICNSIMSDINHSPFYINKELSYSLPDTMSYKNQMAICYSFFLFAKRSLKEEITNNNLYNEILLQDYAMILCNLGKFFYKLNLSLLIKDDDIIDDTILEFGYNTFHTTLTWDDIYNAYEYSMHYIEQAIYYQTKYIYKTFPSITDTALIQLRDMYISHDLLTNVLSHTSQTCCNTFTNLVRFWPNADVKYNIVELARVSNIYADYMYSTNSKKEELILFYDLAQKCLIYIMEHYSENDYIFKAKYDYTDEIEIITAKINRITLEHIDTTK